MSPSTASTLITATAGATVIAGFIYKLGLGLVRASRRNAATQRFTVDMATNHLPHLYHVLTLICTKLEIPVTEPQPRIDFINFDEGEK